jgi:hypothetical protein
VGDVSAMELVMLPGTAMRILRIKDRRMRRIIAIPDATDMKM